MRIGLIAPPWAEVPPASSGGTECIVDHLARGLTTRGHEVVLYSVGSSTCPVACRSLFDAPLDADEAGVEEAAHVLAAYADLEDVDVIHDHTALGPMVASVPDSRRPPVVITHHHAFSAPHRRLLADASRHAAVTAVSKSQARRAHGVPIAAVISHGIDTDLYSAGMADGEYLLFVGRMSHTKGADHAIRVARRSHRHLVVITAMRRAEEQAFFNEHVVPLLDDDITVLIEPDLETRLDLQRGAAALLNPITWDEPFGLVMAEALATATPVIAFDRGAAPEIVDHGRTGFVCADEDEMVAAVARLPRIDRTACRRAAVVKYSRERMIDDYLDVYHAVRTSKAHANGRVTRQRGVPSAVSNA
jgi:glycosyltransferase involved in cell wall biosynthesis